MKKIGVYSLIGFGAIPLGIYPFLLLANIMSLFGHKKDNIPLMEVVINYSFLIGTTLYPVFYGFLTYLSISSLKNDNTGKAIIFSSLSLVLILVFYYLFELTSL